MNYIKSLSQLFHYKHIDEAMVARLYDLSLRSLIAILAFSLVLVYTLYPALSSFIVVWEVGLVILSLIRLYFIFLKRKEPEKFGMLTWYKLFVFFAFLTATFFSIVGSIGLFHLDEVRQIFVVATMIGLTAGAMSSLFPDIRIVIGYISIILIPMIFALVLLDHTFNFTLASLVMVYFISQIIITRNTYKENNELIRRQDEVYRAKLKITKREEAMNQFFAQAPVCLFAYDNALVLTDCNQAFTELFKVKKEEVLGNDLKQLPDTRPIMMLENALQKAGNYSGPYISTKGFELWIEAQAFPIYNEANNVVGGICMMENKTNERKALEDLQYLALHDPLTSLLNRRGLKEYMATFLQSPRHQTMYSLLVYLDLNKFKHINDSLGHKAGDKLLISIASRLETFMTETCLISRFGGDEFITVSPFVADNRVEAEERSQECIRKILNAFMEPFQIDTMKLSIRTSMGIVIIEPQTNNIDEIIRFADIAMYQAKKESGNYISYYDTELDKERKRIFTLQHDMLEAAKNNELEIYLQPLVQMKDNQLYAAESLLRWEHPTLGLLMPSEFIPIAIEIGLISEITWWLIDKVCYYISELKKKEHWHLHYISINVNAKQLLLAYFVEEFLEVLHRYELSSEDIMIEITERSLIDNFEDTEEVINALREEGIKCAIDDFGIGYSSLSYLKKLSFDTLKVDRAFIKDIEHKPDDIALVKTIMSIGKQFNYRIVIEGIEEEAQRRLLLEIDEDLVYQGFLFSKAIPCDLFADTYLK